MGRQCGKVISLVKQRDGGYVRIINEPAKSRIENNQCPSCGKPKNEWKRRTDWRCCSNECTVKFECFCIIRDWPSLRAKVFERDNHTCVKCGYRPKRKYIHPDIGIEELTDDSQLIADHILPIALGGKEWDFDNIQTLCLECNKIKTAEDIGKIAKLRAIEKKQSNGQTLLPIPVKQEVG